MEDDLELVAPDAPVSAPTTVSDLYSNALQLRTKEQILQAQAEAEAAARLQKLRDNALPPDATPTSVKTLLLTLVAVVCVVFIGFKGGKALADLVNVAPEEVPVSVVETFIDDEVLSIDVDYNSILRSYYKKFNPARLADVPNILQRYSGKEEELFDKLKKKYGETPLQSEFGFGQEEGKQDNSVPHQGVQGTQKADEDDDDGESLFEDDEEEEVQQVQPQRKPELPKETHRVAPVVLPEGSHEIMSEDDTEDDDGDDDDDDDVDDEQDGDDTTLESDESSDVASTEDLDNQFDLSLEEMYPPEYSKGKVSVVVIGLPYTGIDTLLRAHPFSPSSRIFNELNILKPINSNHNSPFNDILLNKVNQPEFGFLDDFDVVTGSAVALFFQEIINTYPQAKVVVAVRDIDDWFRAVQSEFSHTSCDTQSSACHAAAVLQKMLLGDPATTPNEYQWKEKYEKFYSRVLATVPADRRILVNLASETVSDDQLYWLKRFVQASSDEDIDSSKHINQFEPKIPGFMSQLHVQHANEFSGDIIGSNRDRANKFGQLKVIGVGLEFTGSEALSTALNKLGFTSMHTRDILANERSHSTVSSKGKKRTCSKQPICDITNKLSAFASQPKRGSNFGRDGVFQGVDALVGEAAAVFAGDLLQQNPDVKVVLTVRDLRSWTKSMQCEMKKRKLHREESYIVEGYIRRQLYGEFEPNDYLLQLKYREHVNHIASTIPPDRLLILDVAQRDAFKQLCEFVRAVKCTTKVMASAFPTSHYSC